MSVVTDPRITVVESADTADPAALNDALELLVKWAVRASAQGLPHECATGSLSGRPPVPSEAATAQSYATYGVED